MPQAGMAPGLWPCRGVASRGAKRIFPIFSPDGTATYQPRASPYVHGPHIIQPQRGETYQPRASPWVHGPKIPKP